MSTVLAATPPMGWNSWNLCGRDVNEDIILAMADAMVSEGLRDAGYKYVIIDDLWQGGRDGAGRLWPDPRRFPRGMAALADAVHARGLKLGIYSDAGPRTCGGAPGSQGHEVQDARTFASWGVDFLKYDYCHAPEDRTSAERLYTTMGRALAATGRPIVFSMCEWGRYQPWLWATAAGGHMWRTSYDLIDTWWTPDDSNAGNGIVTNLDRAAVLAAYAGPGHWNDPDMLVVGLHGAGQSGGSGCTETEYRAQMSLWCLLAAPLIASCDLRAMSAPTRETLLDRAVIAIDQDPLGRPAQRVARDGEAEVWAKPMLGRALAVGLFNRGEHTTEITVHWADLGLSGPRQVRDVWHGAPLGPVEGHVTREVASHGVVLLHITPHRAAAHPDTGISTRWPPRRGHPRGGGPGGRGKATSIGC